MNLKRVRRGAMVGGGRHRTGWAGRLLALVLGLAFGVLPAGAVESWRCVLTGPVALSQVQGSAALIWATSAERGVIGYDLLQAGSAPGSDIRLNPALIAASNSPAGGTYNWPVPAGLAVENTTVVLRIWTQDAAFTDQAGRIERRPEVSAAPAILAPTSAPGRLRSGKPSPSGLSGVETVDVPTSRAGVYFLSFSELADAFQIPAEEVARRADAGRLELRQQGVPVPGWSGTAAGGCYFFAPRIESLFFEGNVTQVRFEEALPVKSVVVPADLGVGRTAAPGWLTVEQNRQAVPTLPGAAEDDFWVWDPFLGGHPSFGKRTYLFDLAGLAAGGASVGVTVEIISSSVAQHEFTATLNGQVLGTQTWSGPQRQTLSFAADSAWWQATGNALELTSTGDRLSLAYLDRFRVGYLRRLEPGSGSVLFSAPDDSVLEATGPAGTAVEVWDVTAAAQPVRLVSSDLSANPGTLRFPGTPGHAYVTFLRGSADRPEPLRPFGPDSLHGVQPGAGYLVIAPDLLVASAGALADRRSAQGLSARVVPLGQIHHEFGFGLPTPAALAQFLAYAHSHWSARPQYGVLLGDGTYDYKNYSGNTDNLIPPLVTLTQFGRAVSDELFGDLDHDGRPEIAMGRLPVHSAAELVRVVEQLADFEARVVPAPRALLLADQPDEVGDFTANAQAVQALLSPGFSVAAILNVNLTTETVRDRLYPALAEGVSVFNYIGHGGRDRLGSGYLTETDVSTLDFGPEQPLVVAMTCAAGVFGLPGVPCLAEVLLLKTGRAPVAMWSPSGFSIDFQAHQLNLLLADQLARQPLGTRLGDTLRRVVTAYIEQGGDLVSPAIYNLIGDPGLRLNFGTAPVRLEARIAADGLQLDFVGGPRTTYQVEASVRLDGPDWQEQGEVVTDDTGRAGFVQALSTGPGQRFFRVTYAR